MKLFRGWAKRSNNPQTRRNIIPAITKPHQHYAPIILQHRFPEKQQWGDIESALLTETRNENVACKNVATLPFGYHFADINA